MSDVPFPADPDEEALAALVLAIGESGSLRPVIRLLREGGGGRQQAVEALGLLAELDPESLVRAIVETLASDDVHGPALQRPHSAPGDAGRPGDA